MKLDFKDWPGAKQAFLTIRLTTQLPLRQHGFAMQVESKFYQRLHNNDAGYGRNAYDVPRLMAAPAFHRWLQRSNKSQFRILDIGCGKGQFLFDLTESLRHQQQAGYTRIAVVDLIRMEGTLLERISPKPEFFQQSVDGQKLPFADASFDFVSCNHVLEHIFETEKFLREIRRVTQPGGLVVISVPNTAAWMSRLAFLFAGTPLGSEVGTESVTYGFWPGFLQDRLKRFEPSGHIRDFTPRSLHDLTAACGFKPAGWWAQNGGLFPTLKRNIGILLELQPDAVSSSVQS
ncbi:MAG: class I SAM-dependent methyltransferase [Limisphaerales bacterium]